AVQRDIGFGKIQQRGDLGRGQLFDAKQVAGAEHHGWPPVHERPLYRKPGRGGQASPSPGGRLPPIACGDPPRGYLRDEEPRPSLVWKYPGGSAQRGGQSPPQARPAEADSASGSTPSDFSASCHLRALSAPKIRSSPASAVS